MRLKHIRQPARSLGVEVHDDDENHTTIGGNRAQECLQGAQAAGRGTDGDDQRLFTFLRSC